MKGAGKSGLTGMNGMNTMERTGTDWNGLECNGMSRMQERQCVGCWCWTEQQHLQCWIKVCCFFDSSWAPEEKKHSPRLSMWLIGCPAQFHTLHSHKGGNINIHLFWNVKRWNQFFFCVGKSDIYISTVYIHCDRAAKVCMYACIQCVCIPASVSAAGISMQCRPGFYSKWPAAAPSLLSSHHSSIVCSSEIYIIIIINTFLLSGVLLTLLCGTNSPFKQCRKLWLFTFAVYCVTMMPVDLVHRHQT